MAEESTNFLRHYFNGGGSALPAIEGALEAKGKHHLYALGRTGQAQPRPSRA